MTRGSLAAVILTFFEHNQRAQGQKYLPKGMRRALLESGKEGTNASQG